MSILWDALYGSAWPTNTYLPKLHQSENTECKKSKDAQVKTDTRKGYLI